MSEQSHIAKIMQALEIAILVGTGCIMYRLPQFALIQGVGVPDL